MKREVLAIIILISSENISLAQNFGLGSWNILNLK